MNMKLVASAILFALIGAAPASATVADYTLAGIGSGTYTDGSDVTPFSDVSFVINAVIDTSRSINDPGVAFGYGIDSATISAEGHTEAIVLTDSYAVYSEGAHAGALVFGSPPFDSPAIFINPVLAGYDGLSDLGPIPLTYYDGLGTLTPNLANGAQVNFTAISDATLQVSATPEPSVWALMIAGVGSIGLILRRSRKVLGFGTARGLSI
ncbi:MAG: PEP-CTERM sorting domain-containing protein [Caulobacteraceae bacterium]|nr:PEP-CTERM sorting domain-containing protein [Caulobacteraceae bacterium]